MQNTNYTSIVSHYSSSSLLSSWIELIMIQYAMLFIIIICSRLRNVGMPAESSFTLKLLLENYIIITQNTCCNSHNRFNSFMQWKRASVCGRRRNYSWCRWGKDSVCILKKNYVHYYIHMNDMKTNTKYTGSLHSKRNDTKRSKYDCLLWLLQFWLWASSYIMEMFRLDFAWVPNQHVCFLHALWSS